jgi:hypothetical protein
LCDGLLISLPLKPFQKMATKISFVTAIPRTMAGVLKRLSFILICSRTRACGKQFFVLAFLPRVALEDSLTLGYLYFAPTGL